MIMLKVFMVLWSSNKQRELSFKSNLSQQNNYFVHLAFKLKLKGRISIPMYPKFVCLHPQIRSY